MREIELRLPLGLRFSFEDINRERDEIIYVAEQDGQIVSSCQFIMDGTKAKMRQVATKKSIQGKGIGKKLYLFSESELRKQNVNLIYCHARKSAVSFYESLGFNCVSEEFMEIGIPHIRMEKTLV